MKYFFVYMFLFLSVVGINAQTQNAAQIRQKMSEIRKKTNWENKIEAKKANEEIQKLAKQLATQGKNKNVSGNEEMQEEVEKEEEYKTKINNQILKSSLRGEEADVLLAEPIREEIVEDYKDDESPVVKNPAYFEKMTMLCIDMSLPTVQRTINQMKKYTSVKTLIITGGKFGVPVNLEDLLTRAADYPLEQLYIINFKQFVPTVPSQVAKFKNLTLLSLLNNKIQKLPVEVGALTNLKTLYVDINPIKTLLPAISKLKQLENLGMCKTNVSSSEIEKIKQLLPNCNIMQK